jgi:hypothetical protein
MAERTSGGSVSGIYLPTNRGSGTTVTVYRNRRTTSSRQCICHAGARACSSEVSNELGTFGRDELGIFCSESSSELHRILKETTKQLSPYNESAGDVKLDVNISAGIEEAIRYGENLDNMHVSTTNRNLSACKDCNF